MGGKKKLLKKSIEVEFFVWHFASLCQCQCPPSTRIAELPDAPIVITRKMSNDPAAAGAVSQTVAEEFNTSNCLLLGALFNRDASYVTQLSNTRGNLPGTGGSLVALPVVRSQRGC